MRRRLVWTVVLALLAAHNAAYAREIVVTGSDSAAIAVAIAKAAAGDTVRLLTGEYRLDAAIAPKSGTRLIGDGADRTILRFAATTPCAMVDMADRQDVRISGLALDAGNNPLAGGGIIAHNASRLRIDHVSIRNLPANALGIHFTGDDPSNAHGVTDSVIEDCLLENLGVGSEWGGGIRLSRGSMRNRILRNTIRNTGRGGIFADNGSGDLIVRGNTVTGSHGEGLGLEIWGDCHRCLLEDNVLDHWLSISGCDRCAARRNVIRDTSGTIKFLGIEVLGSDEVITDNLVTEGQQIGLSVSNNVAKDRVFWGYDRVEGCVQWGAQLQGDTTGLTDFYFYRCQFVNNGSDSGKPMYPADAGHGFRINENARNIVLDDCEFSGNRGLGIQINGHESSPVDGLLFAHCRIENNGKAAAAVWPGYRALTWRDCVVRGNADNSLPPSRGPSPPHLVATIERPTTLRTGTPAAFVAHVVGAPAASILWDFGDGLPETTPTVTHRFDRPGRYRVTLLVWDAQGHAAHTEQTLAVKSP